MNFFKAYLKSAPTESRELGKLHASARTPTAPISPPVSLSKGVSSLDAPTISSRPGSAYRQSTSPSANYQNSSSAIDELKADVMVTWLHQRQLEKLWTNNGIGEGVILKRTRDDYTCCPADLKCERNGVYEAVKALNVKVAMTVNTRVIKLFLRQQQDMLSVPLAGGLRLQLLPNVSYLPRCQKHQFAAFIQDSSMLLVWDDEPKHLLDRANNIEDQLMSIIWRGEGEYGDGTTVTTSKAPSVKLNEAHGNGAMNEAAAEPPRKTMLIQPILAAFTLILIFAAIGSGWREIAIELVVDKSWLRLAFLAVVPIQIWLALFFCQSIAGCAAQLFGPISQMHDNTKFYSGRPPVRISDSILPHVTIQCPVYKEGLYAVIDPTVKSIKAAISTYEMQGGSANIFVNDDGMQVLSAEDAHARREYYEEHNIGWVSRPKHNPKPRDGEKAFLRPGKFKKASNMNYAMYVSARVEDRLAAIDRTEDWMQDDECEAYDAALARVIQEDEGRTCAQGNVRMGDYILLIDSDTRVPVDCFLDAVSEMELSPQVAIIQFSSGVMNVTASFFEKGITFFTNLVYTAIEFAVANGDVAPFVGHNAVLRWSAIQDIAYIGDDGREKYWSEKTVSEDFDMALRLQTSGYILRLAAWADQGFKEGVSLTVYDELARWEKYAYGCNELLFHPLKYWLVRGPFTPLFRRFMTSNMPLPSKLTIMAYIGTYYAIGSAWILTLMNYLIVGWYNGFLDHYYLDSFKIYFAIIIVFTALGNVALAILRYRVEQRTLFGAFIENFKWVPLLTVFLGGISLHVSQAILSHMFSIDMSWGATSKEAEDTSFFSEIPKLIRKFKFTFVFCILMTAGMIILAGIGPVGKMVPYDWQITFFTPIWPLATIVASHFLLPVVLNPGLMLFTW